MKDRRIFIQGLDCPDCAKVLEDDLRGVAGVEKVGLEFMRGSLHVTGNFDTKIVHERIQALGYSVRDAAPNLPVKQGGNSFSAFWVYLFKRFEFKLALLGGSLLLFSFLLTNFNVPDWSILFIRLSALSLAGYPVFRSGLKNLFANRFFNINFLMMMAAVGAVVIGEFLEAAIMLILFTVSEALEGYTNDRARAVLSEFTTLAPGTALRITLQGEEDVPVEALNIGDVILVRSGERFPMDGEVVDGFSDVDQAPITGEGRLIAKKTGDEVLSGTINGQGALKVRVTCKAVDSTIQRIIKLVTEAQSAKAESQKTIDKFAKYYTPAVVVLAALIALLPPLLFNMPFWNTVDVRGWFHRAISLLVIGCPCALVISTPVTIISSLIAAAKAGVIFKGGIFIEGLSRVKVFAFDKTGTLTRGKPELVQLRAVDCSGEEDCEACDDLLALACALEERSSHPLRNAVLEAGALHQVRNRYKAAEGLVTLGGKGLQGKVDGHLATIGSLALFEAEHNTPQILSEWTREAEEAGQTTMLVCDGDAVRGFIGVADGIRAESAAVIADLKHMGRHTLMLTGDNQHVAEMVSKDLMLDELFAQLLPEDKLTAINALRSSFGKVVMVGDGINDSPALALADIGIAMGGSGSAQVLETADIVLMGDDLRKLSFAIRLSAFANKLIRQNIVFSLGTKFIVAILAVFGLTPLWLAVLADMGVSLLVTFNGMRALRFRERDSSS